MIVPDLLGYGESSKPLDVKFYSGKGMAGDVWEVLKHERVERVVGVAHDWFVLFLFFFVRERGWEGDVLC